MTKKTRLKRKLQRLLPLDRLDCASLPSGCNGTYLKLSEKVGIKMSNSSERSQNTTFFQMMNRSANREARRMRMVRRYFGLVPRCYGVVVFKDLNERWRTGILMQHLGNTTLWDIRKDEEHEEQCVIRERIEDALRKRRISHGDLHSKNIMRWKGQFWPIDFANVYKF